MLQLLGALGLFLLGMWLMTEGLKLAGGKALEHLLGQWTKTRARGYVAGVLVTALVQSSSAVTVATIGFVNASLMTFRQSIWVIFGSNVGTTLTAWLVTLFGFSVKLDTYTFAMVGIGAFLKVFAPNERIRSLGMAVAGFGLLFMGIEHLQHTFAGLADQIDLAAFSQWIGNEYVAGLILGTALTLLTQSSSAAIALILTAVASNLAGLEFAAAAVIGANIGTTSTAILATLAATANAKRLAYAHVLFNVLTATVALLLIGPILWTIASAEQALEITVHATLTVTIFHSVFNILGSLLMIPVEPKLSAMLLKRFDANANSAQSQLDSNISQVPDLALRAGFTELRELQDRLLNIDLQQVIQPQFVADQLLAIEQPIAKLNQFIQSSAKQNLTESQARAFTQVLAASHYLHNANQALMQMAAVANDTTGQTASVRLEFSEWLKQANTVLHNSKQAVATEQWQALQQSYQTLKLAILGQGLQLELTEIDALLQSASFAKRYIEQMLQLSPLLEPEQ